MGHIDDWGAVQDMLHLFPPDSRASRADMKGTAALGHWGKVRCGVQGDDRVVIGPAHSQLLGGLILVPFTVR